MSDLPMADILITGGVLIPVDPERRIIADGAVAIIGNRLAAVGPTTEVTAAYRGKTVIDAQGMAILPGLIDGHAHAGHGLIKTMGGGRSDLWYQACEAAYTVGSTPEFWRAEAQLAALERLRFGVTTGVSLLGGGDSVMRSDDPIYCDAHCDGVMQVGTRSIVALGPTRPPHPRTYATWTNGQRNDAPVSFDQQIDTCRRVIGTWHKAHDGRIEIAIITPTLRPAHRTAMGDGAFAEAQRQALVARAVSRELGVIFTQDGHGRGSVAMAHEQGLLGPDAVLSHATELTDEEIAICASTDTRIAHNPSAVASILGRCPATELISAGVTVCLGSDATAPDRSADMFRHMQQCMHYHRTHFRDPSWLPPGRVLEMCTIDAAHALGRAHEIGSLEVGKKADVILVDLRRPHMYPANMPEYRVVCFANGNDVHSVIVDGRIVLRDRQATSVNESAILDAAESETRLLVERLGLQEHLRTPASFWSQVRATENMRHT
jgi:cytosine/adenosine deaminase-related metal-dependent hydrolase